MENLILFSANDLAKITSHRSGEVKFWRKDNYSTKGRKSFEFIKNSEASFVLLGLSEDIGVKLILEDQVHQVPFKALLKVWLTFNTIDFAKVEI